MKYSATDSPSRYERDDRTRDDLTLRVRHQAAHTGDVAHLQPVTTSTRRHHAVDGVVLREVLLHGLGDLVGGLGPDLDELLATLERRSVRPFSNCALHLRGLLLVAGRRSRALFGGVRMSRERDGHTGTGGPVEAGVLDPVERRGDLDLRVALGEVVDDRRDLALVGDGLEVRVVRRQRLVEERATERGLDEQRSRPARSPRAPSPSAKCRPSRRMRTLAFRSSECWSVTRGWPRRPTRTHGPHRSRPP